MKFASALSLCLLIGCSFAQAGTISFSDSIDLADTDWQATAEISQFDPALGDLVKVTLELEASAESQAFYENISPNARQVDILMGANVSLEDEGVEILSASPTINLTYNPTGFDGTLDFGGTSGGDTGLRLLSDSDMQEYTAAADLALFTGTGTLDYICEAIGVSLGGGGGNLALVFSTEAAASIKVTYEYVPEPATLAMLAMGGLFLIRRR